MKVYRNQKKVMVAFALFLLMTLVSVQLTGEISNWTPAMVIAPSIFFFLVFILFELQKNNLLKSLAKQVLTNGEPFSGYIFSDETGFDPFENFLILSPDKIIICTAYLSIQSKYNDMIGKASGIRILDKRTISLVDLKPSVHRVEIKENGSIHYVHHCPAMTNLEKKLKQYGYPVSTV